MKMLKDKKNRKLRIISFVILFLAAIVFLAPYFWMLSNSFKSTKEILLEPTNMLPKQFTLDGYVKVITDSPFFRWMGNSLFVTVIDTLVVLFTSSLIGLCCRNINQTEQIFVLCNIDHNDDADGGNDDPELFAYIKTGMV